MTPNFAHKIVHSSAMYYQNLIAMSAARILTMIRESIKRDACHVLAKCDVYVDSAHTLQNFPECNETNE